MTRVTPLSEARILAVVQPLADNIFVIVAQANDCEFYGCTCRDLLTDSKADALSLRSLTSQRTLQLNDLTFKIDRDLARLGEDQLIDLLFESLNFGRLCRLDFSQSTTRVLKEPLDQVIIQEGAGK